MWARASSRVLRLASLRTGGDARAYIQITHGLHATPPFAVPYIQDVL
jgi:hypothetical protein